VHSSPRRQLPTLAVPAVPTTLAVPAVPTLTLVLTTVLVSRPSRNSLKAVGTPHNGLKAVAGFLRKRVSI